METMDMDQDTARSLLSEGAFLLILDLPVGSTIGIDFSEYSVAAKFKGFKMIPPGLHFIHYSAVGRQHPDQVSPRSGFFHAFQTNEMFIRRWDGGEEDISPVHLDPEEIQRYRDNLMGSLDQHLAPYSFHEYKKWRELTNLISFEVLDILNPFNGKIRSVTELVSLRYPEDVQPISSNDSNGHRRLTVDNLMPHMKVEPNSRINFTELSKLPKLPPGATASDLTKHYLDQSYTLEEAMKRYERPDDILGELQFAFVTFIVGQVYDSFEQWKAILKLLCSSDQAFNKYPSMYIKFVQVLHAQLKEVPEEIFVDIVDHENFLVTVLRDFFYNIFCNMTIDSRLREKALIFKMHVTDKYKWDFDEEPEDEFPVIVETDD